MKINNRSALLTSTCVYIHENGFVTNVCLEYKTALQASSDWPHTIRKDKICHNHTGIPCITITIKAYQNLLYMFVLYDITTPSG